jgi:hypothetical protein
MLDDTNSTIIRLVQALYQQMPGHIYLNNFRSYTQTYGIDQLANTLLTIDSTLNNLSNHILANTITTHLGLTGETKLAGNAYLEAHFNTVVTEARGKVILDAVNTLATLEDNETYGTAAASFNTTISASLTYSNQPNNTTPIPATYGDSVTAHPQEQLSLFIPASGLINSNTEQNHFPIDLEADHRYRFTCSYDEESAPQPPLIIIYDTSGQPIASSPSSSFTYRPEQSGSHYLSVSSNGDTPLNYSLSATYERMGYTLNFTNPDSMGSDYEAVSSSIESAIQQWANQIILTGPSTATIDIEITGANLGSSTLASASSLSPFWEDGEENGMRYVANNVLHEINTGEDINGSEADVLINLNTSLLSSFWFDPTPEIRDDNAPTVHPWRTQEHYDFVGTIMHEFAHALGYNGWYHYSPPPNGATGLENSFNQLSEFDRNIEWSDIQNSFVFTGSNATETYQTLEFSGYLPLHSEGDASGVDLYHYGSNSSSDSLGDYLMDDNSNPGTSYTISSLDTAILQDLGYLIG